MLPTTALLLRPNPAVECSLGILPESLIVHGPRLGCTCLSPTAAAAEAPLSADELALVRLARRVVSGEAPPVPGGDAYGATPRAHPRALHAPGVNDPDLLGPYVPDELRPSQPVRLSDTFAAPPALSQPGFQLAAVFDPASAEDSALFDVALPDDDDDLDREGESEDDSTEAVQDDQSIRAVRGDLRPSVGVDALDEELDALLGGPEAFWSTPRERRSRWRARGSTSSSGSNRGAVSWAVPDTVDVSDFSRLVPEPALTYPFDLDVFQRRAIFRLERGENVFVAAHTSAGKTVVAEYAIALALRNRTRVVYTSPIKTLSNQKFRDFTDRFGYVGLITGDVSLNPEAPVLVMTTEILRSMLYRGADLIRDLEFVVFDEVHWASDPERGVVWEESIILLPESCGVVMLSATVPNALEFASWVGGTKHRVVYVVSTQSRPVPLMHSVVVRSELFPLLESTKPNQFLQANYKAAVEKFNNAHSTSKGSGKPGTGSGNAPGSGSSKVSVPRVAGASRQHTWGPLIKYLRKHELDPALVFCFSKRKCEEAADSLYATDLTTGASERNQIHHFYTTCIGRLSPSDRRVPQIARCLDSLKRGIGVHHAGILPIVKEATEVLFQRGLVRVLFCTETFAVGVNAPARTVVFSAIKKWDGSSMRALEPGEYVQMAGRAGRRGKDTVGTVLLYPAPADFPSEIELRSLLMGSAKRMKSQFRLTYNMILNLMRLDELRVEDVMSRSFSEAPAGRNTPQWKMLLDKGAAQLKKFDERGHELDRFRELHSLWQELRRLTRDLSPLMPELRKLSPATLEVGRVILVGRKDCGLALAAVVKSSTARTAKLGMRASSSTTLSRGNTEKLCRAAILYGGPAATGLRSPFMLPVAEDAMSEAGGAGLTKSQEKMQFVGGLQMEVVDVERERVHAMSRLSVNVNERGMNPLRGPPERDAVSSIAEQLLEFAKNGDYAQYLPLMQVGEDVRTTDVSCASMWSERNEVVLNVIKVLERFVGNGPTGELGRAMNALDRESSLRRKVGELEQASSDESLQLMPDFRKRVEVLQRLGYVEGGSVLLKGRAMCEVNCCELILVELCFENAVQGMSAASMAAVLSALVYQAGGSGLGGGGAEDRDDESAVIERLKTVSTEVHEGAEKMRGLLVALGTVMAECGLPVAALEYVQTQANFGLAEAVYAWAQGHSFVDVCSCAPDVAEGTIVRAIVRLSELLREVKNVGRIIGDARLQELAEEAANAIKRDVIFAASLYVT